jgi:hypothetical protein
LRPIVLAYDQCVEYRLPRTPIKKSDQRGARFERRFGEGATELDALEALHPGVLRRIVETEIARYYDATLQDKWDAIEYETRLELAYATEEVHADHAMAIDPIVAEYEAIDEAAHALHSQATDAIAPIVAEYQVLVEGANVLRARAAAAIDSIVAEYQVSVVEAAHALWARAEPIFAEVTVDLKERGKEILAGMEAINADGNEDEDPLFDSTRDYVEQIDRYKEFQGKATASNNKGPRRKVGEP